MKSWIEISAARLTANFAAVRRAAGAEYEILCVIKADAYGHGAGICAPALVEAGARWLGVGDTEEGVRVREALRARDFGAEIEAELRVVVMCGLEAEDAAGIVTAGLTPVVWTEAQVKALDEAAAAAQQRVAVHLELDTGMARQGAGAGPELAAVLEALRAARFVRCEGMFSHLSSSEVADSAETAKQVSRFEDVVQQVFEGGLIPEYVHLGNSSALDEGSTVEWMRTFAQVSARAVPLVRPGLALYGYTLPIEGLAGGVLGPEVAPVATWKTRVIALRNVKPGATVGYGATFAAERGMRLALLPVGYADGFRREASSGIGDGWVMIGGRRAAVVGRVSMNLTVVDVTGFEEVGVGDEVVLLGEGVTAVDHARWCGTIPYEFLCGMRGHRRLV